MQQRRDAPTQRLSARAIDLVIRRIGVDARLELSAHVLRHTCLTNLVHGGNDLVLVAEIAGHKRLETIRRYCLPSIEDRERAMEELRVDYSKGNVLQSSLRYLS
jgi:site-specific recombinase XerD